MKPTDQIRMATIINIQALERRLGQEHSFEILWAMCYLKLIEIRDALIVEYNKAVTANNK